MKKTVIIIIALCVLLCSCNTANAKTLSSVASSATTLTQELETVRDSGGAVTVDELLELDTVVVIKKADVFWCAATEKEYSSPWAGAETTNSFSSEHATNIMNNYQEMGLCSAFKYTLNDDGVEYEVICTLGFENAEQNISEPSVVFYTKNIATGEVFYDDSVFEDAEITPVQPETEIE